MEVQTWKFRKCWPLEPNPGVNPKVGRHTRLKILMMRDTSVFRTIPHLQKSIKIAKIICTQVYSFPVTIPFHVSCHPAGDVPASWVGAGIIKWPIWRGGIKPWKIYRDFEGVLLEKAPCLGWSKAVILWEPRQLCGAHFCCPSWQCQRSRLGWMKPGWMVEISMAEAVR